MSEQANIERAQVLCRAWGVFRSRVVNELANALDEAEQRGISDCITAMEHDPHSWRDCSAAYFCRTKVDEFRAMLADDTKEPAND